MKTFSYTFGAGETKTFPSGQFFIAITAGDAINVSYFKNAQKLDESAEGIVSGYYVELEKGFDTVQVYSATAQTVKIAISKGGSGGFNISSQIITDIQGGQLTPHTLDSSYSDLIGTSLITIVTPAANVSGVLINDLNVMGYSNGYGRVMSKTSAPSAWNDSTARQLAGKNSASPPYSVSSVPYIIPAGEGVYAQSSGVTDFWLGVSYKIL